MHLSVPPVQSVPGVVVAALFGITNGPPAVVDAVLTPICAALASCEIPIFVSVDVAAPWKAVLSTNCRLAN